MSSGVTGQRSLCGFLAGLALALLVVPAATARPAPGPPSPHEAAPTFDLAVHEIDVRQTGSTPMFREVAIRCVVQNRGPALSRGTTVLVVSRPGDDGPKILKVTPIPVPLARGEKFVVEADGAAWFASVVPYRCEIQWDGSVRGDSDPSDDYGERFYPKM